MNIKSLIAAASLSLLPMLSQASVVYEWEATNNETPRGITFKLEFEESAVQSGGFHFELYWDDFQYGFPQPELGLISFNFSIPRGYGAMFDRQYGYANSIGYNVGYLDMSVGFRSDGVLDGYIRSFSFDTYFNMSSQDGVFTINDLETDSPLDQTGCGPSAPRTCYGATGVIRRLNEVPEPGSLALIGAGLFAVSRIRRRKAAR